MRIRVVLVEPEYSFNIGYACRAMKNFGFSDLWIVNPKCSIDVDSYRGAKHAKEILEAAKTAQSLPEALKGCHPAIATTGIKIRNKGTIRSAIGLRRFAKMLPAYKNRKIALVFGREGIGLNENELNQCDLLVSIESSPAYPALNISHAIVIILYEISKIRASGGEEAPSKAELEALMRIFSSLSSKFRRKNMLAPIAFRRLAHRAGINRQECLAFLSLFRILGESPRPGKRINFKSSQP